VNLAFIANLLTSIHDFGAKSWINSLIVLTVLYVASATADHFLGAGNAISSEMKTIGASLDQPVSPTIVVSGTTV
jgi:hypothetical protein